MDKNIIPKLPWNIYWINLKKREDRKKDMEEIFKNNNHIRIEAVDGRNDLNKYKFIFNSVNNTRNDNIRNIQLSCMMSHIKAMKAFISNETDNNPFCFISEDDCYNKYSTYWKEKHWKLINSGEDIEILQMATTGNLYNDPSLNPINASASGTSFYMIKRDIAKKIVDMYYKDEFFYDFSSYTDCIIADSHIWRLGNTKLIPMLSVSTIDENPSDISVNKDHYENEYWESFFKDAIQKYLNFWKELK